MRRLAAGVVLLAGIVVAVVLLADGGSEEPAAASQSAATTRIDRKDLVETEDADGTLGFTDVRAVSGKQQGTITWLPSLGDVVRTNSRLYAVDGEPVYLLNGAVPAWRALAPGTEGTDVLQLERNLRTLGFDPDDAMEVDGTWDAGTTDAVARWQERKGLTETGTIELGRVVFLPGDRRVSELPVPRGATDTGATPLLKTTSTRRRVTVALGADRQELAVRGAGVEVELPGGDTVKGAIEDVGAVASSETEPDGSQSDPTIDLTIRLRDTPRRMLDQAPVDVHLERGGVQDALTVPVTALLARSGGGYAVEVHDGAGRRVVPVDPGVFADGDVEIRGEGLREGMTVTDARV